MGVDVGQFAGGTGSDERRRVIGNADRERHVVIRDCGYGLELAGGDKDVHIFDYGIASCEYDHSFEYQLDDAGFGAGWRDVQRHVERNGRNAGLHVVRHLGKPSGRFEPVQWGRDFGHADSYWPFCIHGWREGQWLADCIGPGIHYGFTGRFGDYVDKPGGSKEWQFVQHDADRDGWNAELRVVGEFWQPSGWPESVAWRRDLRYADGQWHFPVHGCGEG